MARSLPQPWHRTNPKNEPGTCRFYYQFGACRYGNNCFFPHQKPTTTPTLLLPNLYRPPTTHLRKQEHFEEFYAQQFKKLSKHGDIRRMSVCENWESHLAGNVFVEYWKAEDAERAYGNLKERGNAGRPINIEFSPVTNFEKVTCGHHKRGACARSDCSFWHVKKLSRDFQSKLFTNKMRGRSHSRSNEMRSYGSGSRRRRHSRSRSHSRIRRAYRHRSYEEFSDRSCSPRRRDDRDYDGSRSWRSRRSSRGGKRDGRSWRSGYRTRHGDRNYYESRRKRYRSITPIRRRYRSRSQW